MRQLPIWCMLKCARLYGSYSANTSSDLPLSAYGLLLSFIHACLTRFVVGCRVLPSYAQTECTDNVPMTSLPLLLCQESLPVLTKLGYDLCTGCDGAWKGCMMLGLNTSIWQTTHNSTNRLTCLMKFVDELVDPWAVFFGVPNQVQCVIW